VSIVDESGSYLQFALRVSSSVQGNASVVSVYYRDDPPPAAGGHWDAPVAQWTVPSLVGRWTSLIVRANGRHVSLYVDCHAQTPLEVVVERGVDGLTFDSGSVVYVAQAGPRFGHHFEVHIFIFILEIHS